MNEPLPPTPPASRTRSRRDHIVDTLIEERAPTLSASMLWPALRPALYRLLNYDRARRMADEIAPLDGRAPLEHVTDALALDVRTHRLERLPREGSFFLIANHPTGIADGIAVFQGVRAIRPDLMIYANADAHRVSPGFSGSLIPVEWVLAKRTLERTRLTLKRTSAAIAAGQPILVFPAGRLARIRADGRLTDPEWQTSAVSLARKHGLTVIPCHVSGPYAFWFHMFDKVSKELRDITLFHELLNKRGRRYTLTFGPAIAAESLAGDAGVVTRKLKRYIERVLEAAPDQPFDPEGPECAWRDPPPAP